MAGIDGGKTVERKMWETVENEGEWDFRAYAARDVLDYHTNNVLYIYCFNTFSIEMHLSKSRLLKMRITAEMVPFIMTG